MANSLYQQLNPQSQATASSGLNMNAVQSVKNMMNMFKGAANPQQMMMNMMSQNPQMAGIMRMLNGRDPKTVFYEQCKQSGINPDEVINALR